MLARRSVPFSIGRSRKFSRRPAAEKVRGSLKANHKIRRHSVKIGATGACEQITSKCGNTKPCTPAVWLGSAWLSAVAVSLLLNGIVLGSALVLSLLWHVPVRAGLVFVSVDTFVASLGLIAYLMLLATLLHPAVAATVALIFNADMFYSVQLWTLAAIRSGNSSRALRVLARVFHYLYLALPMIHPYGKETRDVYMKSSGGTRRVEVSPVQLGLWAHAVRFLLPVGTACPAQTEAHLAVITCSQRLA